MFEKSPKGPNNTEEIMAALRSTLMVGAVLVAVAVVGVVRTNSLERAGSVQRLMEAPAVPTQQSVKLAERVNCLLAGTAPEARRLRVFVNSVRVLAQSGAARERCACPGGRMVDGVCRQMGELLLRQQALEREGRKPQVAAFLNKVHEARASGMPEAQVRAMVRNGLANGELRLSADSESKAVRQQLAELNRQLVAGEASEPMQISAR
jgi:hypothetical protein